LTAGAVGVAVDRHVGFRVDGGAAVGVECKLEDAPVLTSSLRSALADLKLDEFRVVYSGAKRYALTKKVEVVPLAQIINAK